MIGRQKISLVFTNQLRQKMNAMPFGDPWTTSGGKALRFPCICKIEVERYGTNQTKGKWQR